MQYTRIFSRQSKINVYTCDILHDGPFQFRLVVNHLFCGYILGGKFAIASINYRLFVMHTRKIENITNISQKSA